MRRFETGTIMTEYRPHPGLLSPRRACMLTALNALLLSAGVAYSGKTLSEPSLDGSVHGTTGAQQVADRPTRMSIRSGHRWRDYFLFVPGSIAPDTPAPVLL